MVGYDKKRRHESYIKNKERENAQSKAYKELHKEEIKAWKQKYRKENQEEIQKKQREWVEKNREHVREYMREYSRNRRSSEPAFREKLAKYAKASCEKHRDETKARKIARSAIASGRIRRQPCEVCGAEPAQAHHDDYNYPLKVRWLCSVCHAEWHRHNQPIRKEEMETRGLTEHETDTVILKLTPSGKYRTDDIEAVDDSLCEIKKSLSNKKVKAFFELNGYLPDGVESTGSVLRIKVKEEA